MSDFKLSDLRDALEKKYGTFRFWLDDDTCVEMQNILRISDENRERLVELQKAQGDEDGDSTNVAKARAVIEEMFSLVIKDPKQYKALIKEADGDLAFLVELFKEYTGETQAGEADGSQD